MIMYVNRISLMNESSCLKLKGEILVWFSVFSQYLQLDSVNASVQM